MGTVYTISKPCGCTVRRTIDKAEAVEYAKARPGSILDAIPCRTDAAEQRALTGDIVLSCDCEKGNPS